MSSKFKALLIFLLTLCCSPRPVHSRGHYTAIAPGTIRSNSEYFIALSLDDFGGKSSWFNISIIAHCAPKLLTQIDEVEVQPNSTKLVKMNIPKLTHTCAKLKIEGVRGIHDYHEAILYVETHDFTVYIQTDKAKYKPGELVQFRVICIDRLTCPAQVKEAIEVFVFDGENNLIKKISHVKLVKGVFRGDLQLSEYPVLGDWRFEVKADGYVLQNKSFEVSRYELAKFSVEIDTKQDVSLEEGRIDITVKSSYTYDQPVKGNLTVTIHTKYSLYGTRMVHVSKYSTIIGEATISFNFNEDLSINTHSTENTFILYTFDVTANVTNSLTGQTRTAMTDVNVYRQPYKVQLKAPANINPGEMFDITVSVKDLQGNPILDAENPITIKLSSIPIVAEYQTVNMAYLDESGTVTVSMLFPKTSKQKIFQARAEYLDCASHWIRLNEKISNVFHLDVLTEKPEVGKLFVIEIWSKDPINYFVYEILSRGDIIKTERIDVPGNVTKYHLSLNATYLMVPKIIFFMHRITNSIMDSQLKEIHIRRDFQNSIRIDAEAHVKPGKKVSVNVTTDDDSYIGLMGIDESLLLDTDDYNNLNEDNVYTQIRNFDSINMNNAIYPGAEAGLVTFSNALNRAGYGIDVDVGTRVGVEEGQDRTAFDKPSVELPRIRKLFSESWIFRDFERSPSEVLKLNETIPDTITSWALTGFSLNSNTGLALTKNATKVRVFQEFFITFDLPSLVKAGELIEIPVYIFNYFDEDLVSNVMIESSSEEIKLEPKQTISKSVSAKGSEKLIYLIKPAKPGLYTVTVKATSNLASDTVQKALTVEAEGIPFSFSKTYLVHFLQESEQEDDIFVDIPENAVLGSETLHLAVVGDIFGTLMNGLEKLIRHQHGNGADNMRFFVSNLMVLKYLAALNHSIPVIENKAKWHLELAYQNQFAYKHSDGSFAILDRTVGKTGDIWLTAYVIWALQQAKGFIHVRTDTIDKGLNYLKNKQSDNGCFSSTKSVDDDISLTGFAMLAFLLDEKSQNKYEDVITKGLRFLYETLDKVKLSPSAAMSTYVLVLGKHEKAEELLTKLHTHTELTGEQLIWTKPDNIESKLETTAYSFLCLLESQKKSIQTLFPILRSLIVTGGIGKTSAHTVALEAMIKFAKEMHLGRNDLKITYNDNQEKSRAFHITTDNAQVQQKVELNKETRKVRLQSKGKGFALVELKYKYNLLIENQSTSIYETNVTFIESSNPIKSILEICVAIRLQEGQNNVAVMKVNLLTGSSIDETSFEMIKWKNKQVKLIQMNENDHSVLVLFESITQNGMCIQLLVTNKFKVSNTKPMSVIVFDAYKDDQQSVSFFNATSSED